MRSSVALAIAAVASLQAVCADSTTTREATLAAAPTSNSTSNGTSNSTSSAPSTQPTEATLGCHLYSNGTQECDLAFFYAPTLHMVCVPQSDVDAFICTLTKNGTVIQCGSNITLSNSSICTQSLFNWLFTNESDLPPSAAATLPAYLATALVPALAAALLYAL